MSNDSIKKIFETQYQSKILAISDYKIFKSFIKKAEANGIYFNDLNEFYNYFMQKLPQEQRIEITEPDDEDPVANADETDVNSTEKTVEQNKNVVSIFGESGIEVDNKLLDAKVSERMILGEINSLFFIVEITK